MNRIVQTWQRIKQKKKMYWVKYGLSFAILHESLGMASYGLVYSSLYFDWVSLPTLMHTLSIDPKVLEDRGVDLQSKWTHLGATVVIVKALDVLGLLPLRWGLTFYFTPKLARWISKIRSR